MLEEIRVAEERAPQSVCRSELASLTRSTCEDARRTTFQKILVQFPRNSWAAHKVGIVKAATGRDSSARRERATTVHRSALLHGVNANCRERVGHRNVCPLPGAVGNATAAFVLLQPASNGGA